MASVFFIKKSAKRYSSYCLSLVGWLVWLIWLFISLLPFLLYDVYS